MYFSQQALSNTLQYDKTFGLKDALYLQHSEALKIELFFAIVLIAVFMTYFCSSRSQYYRVLDSLLVFLAGISLLIINILAGPSCLHITSARQVNTYSFKQGNVIVYKLTNHLAYQSSQTHEYVYRVHKLRKHTMQYTSTYTTNDFIKPTSFNVVK